MADAPTLDLVHELQVELGWESDFASSARDEYDKWLRLRAQTGDFQNCKLAPSRVVAMVWSLHRQWTLDYERTCQALGGFLHHFPPAMRMNVAREQAYAATIHTYKTVFGQDPPPLYWGPPICSYKPLSASPGAALPGGVVGVGATNTTPRALPSLRRSPAKRDGKSTGGAGKQKKAGEASAVRGASQASDKSHGPSSESDSRLHRRNVKSAKESGSGQASGYMEETVLEGEDHPLRASKTKNMKKLSISSPLYVLRPLRPGEKRKRGRPSFSDYVLASDTDKKNTDNEPGRNDANSDGADKSTAAKEDRGGAAVPKRRKTGASPVKAAIPAIAKKEKAVSKTLRRVSRVVAATAAAAAAVSGASGAGKTSQSASKGASAAQAGPDGKTFPAPLKRPRGRPRKDGSWPVARAKQSEAASSKPAPSVPPKPVVGAPSRPTPGPTAPAEKPASPANDTPASSKGKDTKASENPNDPNEDKDSASVRAAEKAEVGKEPEQVRKSAVEGELGMGDLGGKEVREFDKGTNDENVRRASALDEVVESSSPMDKTDSLSTVPMKSVSQPVSSVPLVVSSGIVSSSMMAPAAMSVSAPMVASNAMSVSNPLVSTSLQPPNALTGGSTLGGADGRILPDNVFAHPDALRDPVEMEVPLSSQMLRTEPIPGASSGDIRVGGVLGEQGPLPSQENGFGIGMTKHSPPVRAATDGGSMPGINTNMGTNVDVRRRDGREDHIDITEEQKPFRRPRGRVRKDGPLAERSKPAADEAVERVKDLTDPNPSLNFSIGPSGTV